MLFSNFLSLVGYRNTQRCWLLSDLLSEQRECHTLSGGGGGGGGGDIMTPQVL